MNEELNRIKENNYRIAAKQQQNQGQSSSINGTLQIKPFFDGQVLKPLGISLAIMLFQQTTGINAIFFHTVSIFQLAGSELDGRYCTIIVGFVQLVFTVASGFFV